ncbi:MAG TPA: SWIM zinc finger family protein [Myxococcaceae bacterium]|nr:SWIM zinc finger family protein [Myxococcaceae bacterium]
MAWRDRYRAFPEYVPVARRRAQARRKVEELRRRGVETDPVVIEGRAIARTFWGKAWCDAIEGYSDFASRLPRGRTYVRNGAVIDLRIEKGRIAALVSGTEIYDVEIRMAPAAAKKWQALAEECAGRIDSVVELLSGKLSSAVMTLLCRREAGLFPSSAEMRLSCSCPDGARLCKHLAAVLYGIGARLDNRPELLFLLRGVDQADLVGEARRGGTLVAPASAPNALSGDLSEIFGIDLTAAAPSLADEAVPTARRRRPKGAAPRGASPRQKRDH